VNREAVAMKIVRTYRMGLLWEHFRDDAFQIARIAAWQGDGTIAGIARVARSYANEHLHAMGWIHVQHPGGKREMMPESVYWTTGPGAGQDWRFHGGRVVARMKVPAARRKEIARLGAVAAGLARPLCGSAHPLSQGKCRRREGHPGNHQGHNIYGRVTWPRRAPEATA